VINRQDTIILIPSRLESTRLPQKPLIEFDGLPMIVKIAKTCIQVVGKSQVIVLTPNPEIIDLCTKHNVLAELSSSECQTGTDRLVNYSKDNDFRYYVNVQGDEPLLSAKVLENFMLKAIELDSTVVGVSELTDKNEIESGSVVKVATSNSKMIYASRAAIPFDRDGIKNKHYKHTGLYVFRKEALQEFQREMGPLEEVEKVEILRLIENRIIVRTVEVPNYGPAVDTPQDVVTVQGIIDAL
jgi:3-deoxy-manno-octulosonate cytidylyltransferase (CMP-KDO synthetase)